MWCTASDGDRSGAALQEQSQGSSRGDAIRIPDDVFVRADPHLLHGIVAADDTGRIADDDDVIRDIGVTTAPAPTTALRPMRTPGRTMALMPMKAPSAMWTAPRLSNGWSMMGAVVSS